MIQYSRRLLSLSISKKVANKLEGKFVAKPFDAYSPAITATKKAIEDREAKLAELKEAGEISNSEERSSDFYYQFGRAEMAIELEIGDQKVAKQKN